MDDRKDGVVEFLSSHSSVESDGEVTTTRRSRKPIRSNGNTEKVPLIRSSSNESSTYLNDFDDQEFVSLVHEIESAIEVGMTPQRIYQGSSGSYFTKDRKSEIVGVFKPKDEEPYGQLNPKWTKWLHKLFFPCWFGRSCIVPNQGYLSEAGASLVDEKLELSVVPKTKVVNLASESFHYRLGDRMKIRCRRFLTEQWPDGIGRRFRTDLPYKAGSLQKFVRGYKDATVYLEEFKVHPLPQHMERKLQLQFERLVILDYIIRNTDRGNDNWLIYYKKPPDNPENAQETYTLTSADEREENIRIAAIDNGLAFPFKHPDEWRAYPFQWADLPMSKIPFSEDIIFVVLEKLKSDDFVQELVKDLKNLFKRDRGFDNHTFEKQMAVMRGQILNLKSALEQRKTPYELVNMPANMVETVREGRKHDFIQKFRNRSPFFKGC